MLNFQSRIYSSSPRVPTASGPSWTCWPSMRSTPALRLSASRLCRPYFSCSSELPKQVSLSKVIRIITVVGSHCYFYRIFPRAVQEGWRNCHSQRLLRQLQGEGQKVEQDPSQGIFSGGNFLGKKVIFTLICYVLISDMSVHGRDLTASQ